MGSESLSICDLRISKLKMFTIRSLNVASFQKTKTFNFVTVGHRRQNLRVGSSLNLFYFGMIRIAKGKLYLDVIGSFDRTFFLLGYLIFYRMTRST